MILIEFHHCRVFVTGSRLALHLHHIKNSEHLVAEEFVLWLSTNILEGQVRDWVLHLIVADCLDSNLEWRVYSRDLSLVVLLFRVDTSLSLRLLGSHAELLLLRSAEASKTGL